MAFLGNVGISEDQALPQLDAVIIMRWLAFKGKRKVFERPF